MTSNTTIGLENGVTLSGTRIGSSSSITGELVFATPYTGYEEALTDPSYAGQILMFTYPLIGNYGVREEHFQSDQITPEAVVVRECCTRPSHHSADRDLDTFLREEGVPGIEGVDTRLLTTTLRDEGVLNAAIVPDGDTQEAVEQARNAPDIADRNLIQQVSCREPYHIQGSGSRIAVIDTGLKRNIVRSLQRRGHDVIVMPHDTTPGLVRSFDPDALLFGNGPGDPKRATDAMDLVRTFAGELPIFGICLGSQIVSLALGGDTYKLPFGHRGGNHPVKRLADNELHITSQNHGFAVEADAVEETDLSVTEINPNDGTVEGIASDYLDIHTVQYHPEASPGPMDTEPVFFDRIEEVIQRAD